MKRSPYSLEFERLWRALRSDQKLIPDKSEFKPHLFKHLLPWIGLCEIDTEKKTMIVSLIGEKIRQIAGLDMRGLDLNTWADPKNLPARLERQRLYHDIPVGRADVIEFRYADGVTAFYELTYLPLYGLNNERILTMFFPKQIAQKIISAISSACFSSAISTKPLSILVAVCQFWNMEFAKPIRQKTQSYDDDFS